MFDSRQHTGWRAASALLLVTAVIGIPLLSGRVLGGQDIINYLIIAQQTAANLREGLVFPAWAGGFNAGFGSPLLIFFPPLTGLVNSLSVLVGVPVASGVALSALIAHLLSGLAMLWWLRSTGRGSSALPAAVVYMVAPYRLIDLYLRSALAEHWAFLWPPLILGVAVARGMRASVQVPVLGLLVAALVLTNTPLAVLFGFALAAWVLLSDRLQQLRLRAIAGAALGLALAAFALVPQGLAQSLLNLDACFGEASVRLRPSANTLFAAGLTVWNLNTVFSLVMLATLALAVMAYWLSSPLERRQRAAWIGVVGAVACVVAAMGPAGRVWDAAPILQNLQFPWRLTAVLTLIAAALAARLPVRRAWLVAAVAATLAGPSSGWSRTLPASKFSMEQPRSVSRGLVFPDPGTAWEAGSGGWYWRHDNLVELCLLPKSMNWSMMTEFAGTAVAELDVIRDRAAVLIEAPRAPISVLEWGQVRRVVAVEAPRDCTMLWRVLDFPRMVVTVDGVEVATAADPTIGLVTHLVPAGRHVVVWQWVPFPALVAARSVTIAALVATAGLLLLAAGSELRQRGRASLRESTTDR